jgi:uncharacterized membrane protein
MTHHRRFKAWSIFAGVISLFFGFAVAVQLTALIALAVISWKDLSKITLGYVVGLILMGVIALTAFWCRSRLRDRMVEPGNLQRTGKESASKHS